MPDPGFTRPDLCSIPAADAEAEPAGEVRGGLSATRHPPSGDDVPVPSPRGIDRAIRLSTAAAVLAVAGIAAYVSYGHAYAVVRAHGETGITARLDGHHRRPGLRQFDGGAVRGAAPGASPLPGPLPARAGHRRDPHGEHGPGLVARSRRGGDRGLAGGQPGGLVRTSGLAHPHLRDGRPRAVSRAPVHWCGLLCCGASCPGPGRDRTASASEEASATRQTWRGGPQVSPPGSRLRPPAGTVTMRRVRPALSMTRRWPHTSSACRPATRCRNACSPRCSDAHPAAGRGPGSPMHDRHHRSQTR